jgi:predicted RNase H-like HicB family nuclease
MLQYIALIRKDAGSDCGVSFPDLPGCVTAGVDLDDARRMAEEALAVHLAGMAEDAEPIPESSSLEAVMEERENRDAVAILVKAPPATAKAVRVNMTLPEDELELIDKFAAEHGYIRSGFLLHAAKQAMDPLAELAQMVEAERIEAQRRTKEAVEHALRKATVTQAMTAAVSDRVIESDPSKIAVAEKEMLRKRGVSTQRSRRQSEKAAAALSREQRRRTSPKS